MSNNEKFKLSEYDETIRAVLDSGGEFRLYPRGTSMLPLLRQGIDSVVLVKPNKNLKKGDIPFYIRSDGKYVLHRIVKARNDCYTLCGDNQTALEEGITDENIIGVVSKIYRGNKVITTNNIPYKIYLFIWQSFLIRKIYFIIRNFKNKLFKKQA